MEREENKMFEFDEEDFNKEMLKMFNYKDDPNYDKNFDINYNLQISNKDFGKDKIIKYKIDKEKRKTKINIPKEIKDGQSIVCIKEGRKKDNKYGNLLVKVFVK